MSRHLFDLVSVRQHVSQETTSLGCAPDYEHDDSNSGWRRRQNIRPGEHPLQIGMPTPGDQPTSTRKMLPFHFIQFDLHPHTPG